MNNSYIVIIFGASGSGKTTLMEHLNASGRQYSVHIKHSDRPQRQYDDIELKCVKNFSPQSFDYIYQTYGYRYGIQRFQIDKAVSEYRHHFIICNDISTIRALKRDYGEKVKTIFFYFDAPEEVLRDIQIKRGISDDEINIRLAKTAALIRQFIESYELFDGTIPNYYNESTSVLKNRIETLLSQFARQDKTAAAISNLSILANELSSVITPPTKKCLSDYCFIIMPIRDDDHNNVDTHHTIKRTCEDLGIKADRVDDIQYTGQITKKIQTSIELASFVVADLTNERPNVYYEIGYADACGKTLILVAKSGEKIHFDLQGMNIIFYKGMHHL